MQFILVGGTNGKGSVARMFHALLRAQGLKVGLYTSPHLLRFNERVVVGDREVGDAELEKVLRYFQRKKILDEDGEPLELRKGKPTFFELTTALALEIFRRANVKIAILEVGLGGRFDATNVVFPSLSILVSVGHDHEEILGRGLKKIALEKIGIFRPGRLAFVGNVPGHIKQLIATTAKKSEVHFFEEIKNQMKGQGPFLGLGPLAATFMGSAGMEAFRVPAKGWPRLSMPADPHEGPAAEPVLRLGEGAMAQKRSLPLHLIFPNNPIQQHNLALVLMALRTWRRGAYSPSLKILEKALGRLKLPGRMEVRGNVILDGAHNPEAARALVEFLRRNYPGQKFIFLIGMATSKNRKKFVSILRPLAKKIIFTEFAHPRALKVETWRREFKMQKAEYFRDPQEALAYARKDKVRIVVTGSFFLVGLFNLSNGQ